MKLCSRTSEPFGNRTKGSRRGFLRCKKLKVKKLICRKAMPAGLYSDAKGTQRAALVQP